MSKTRDDFTFRTRQDLALRASYLCSRCGCSTAGPSDEASNAVTMIGVAAHICAAAPGPGARRYDPNMTPAERSHIDNGIWLCASCGILIDRDEIRFSVEALKAMKREHESSRRIGAVQSADAEGDLVSIGPDIVALALMVRSGPDSMRIRVSRFVDGSARELWSMDRDFAHWPRDRRCVLLNEFGIGGLLAGPPVVERVGQAYEVLFRFEDRAARRNATANIAGMSADTGRLITGMDVYVQKFQQLLGLATGSWFVDLGLGSGLSDLYWRYRGSPWFARLAMLDMIRLSSVPRARRGGGEPVTPFLAVNRIEKVEVPSFDLVYQRLAIAVRFDLEGVGPWEGVLSVFVSTPEQLAESRRTAKCQNDRIKDTERESRPTRP